MVVDGEQNQHNLSQENVRIKIDFNKGWQFYFPNNRDGAKQKETVTLPAEKRFTERTKGVTNVKAYTNIKKPVELWVNNKLIGKKQKNEVDIVLWDYIELQKGKNTILIKIKNKKTVLEDTCEWDLE